MVNGSTNSENATPMPKLIPEKTVELYTAFALQDTLGRDTWIWSRAVGQDQDFGDSALRKWFVLELKAPEAAQEPYISIDIKQLDKYYNGYTNGAHPDVLYVLPVPLWRSIPPQPMYCFSFPGRFYFPAVAHPRHRWMFRCWSYVVRASSLWRLLNVAQIPICPNKNPRRLVRVRRNGTGSPALYAANSGSTPVSTLHNVLWKIDSCVEPRRLALRSASRLKSDKDLHHDRLPCFMCRLHAVETLQLSNSDQDPSESSDREDDWERDSPNEEQDLPLSLESIHRAMRTLGEGNRSSRLYVGLQ